MMIQSDELIFFKGAGLNHQLDYVIIQMDTDGNGDLTIMVVSSTNMMDIMGISAGWW